VSEPKCRFVASDQPRAVVGEHYDGCADDRCRGCWPCLIRHCVVCGIEHCDDAHPLTCPTCVGAVRDDLDEIADMYLRLSDEVVWRAHAGDRPDTVLGGDAMVMLAMRYREQTGVAADGDHSHESTTDPTPTLLTLATWEDCYRDHFQQDPPERTTVPAAVGYLRRQLTRIAQAAEIPFEDFARDIRHARAALEDVLHDGKRDITGAPCVNCGAALVRRMDDRRRRHGGYCEGHGHLNWCRLPHTPCCDRGGARDEWECPRCHRVETWGEYLAVVARDYQDHAEWLHAEAIEKRTGIAIGTIRVWVTRGKVRTGGNDSLGRRLYSVEDVERHAEGATSVTAGFGMV
jgi:hypothetical protein